MFKVCKGRGVKGFSFFFFLVTYYNVYAFNKTELLKCGPEPTDLPLPPPPSKFTYVDVEKLLSVILIECAEV